MFISDRDIVWRRETGRSLIAAPVVTSNLVVSVGVEQSSVMAIGYVDAWDRATGRRCWSFSGESNTGLEGGVTGIGLAPDGGVCLAQGTGVLRCLDSGSGRQKWRTGGGKPINTAPLMAGDLMLQTFDDGTLSAVEASDGTRRWMFQAHDVIRASPVLASGHVLVASWDGMLHALRLDGRHVASVDLESADSTRTVPARPTCVVAEADLVVMFDLAVRAVRAFAMRLEANTLSCIERWRVPTGETSDVRPLLVANRVCWSQSEAKVVTCVDADSGAIVWTQPSEDRPQPVVVNDGKLIVASTDGQLSAVDPSSGRVVWCMRTGCAFSSPPAVADDVAFIGGADRALYAVRLRDTSLHLRP